MHSTPISEVIAHGLGLFAGVATFAIGSHYTHDYKTLIIAAVVAPVLVNFIVGAHINFLLSDFAALIFIRPLSAFLGAALTEYIAPKMHWSPQIMQIIQNAHGYHLSPLLNMFTP